MKWKDLYILAFESEDDLSWQSAFALCLRYNVPYEKIAVFQAGDQDMKYKNFLSGATLQSKIIILAHGTTDYIDCSPFGQMDSVSFLLFLKPSLL